MAKIIISYRRLDSIWIARAICDRLVAHYGKGSVFIDVEIPYGSEFPKHIDEVLSKCDVLLAVVGRKWLGANKGKDLRIKDENDWVRKEIEIALQRNIPIVPILVDGARMPRK